MRSLQASLTVSSLLYLTSSQTISVNLDASDNEYLNTEVEWGTPGQTFSVMVDTTDHTSWVYDEDANTPSSTMDTSESGTFRTTGTSEVFSYQDETTKLDFATDTFTIGKYSVDNIEFAVATDNFTITDEESLSGFLSLDRSNPIIAALKANEFIENQTVSIDVSNQKLHIGAFTPSESDYHNVSNGTSCARSSNENLLSLWIFNISVFIDDTPALASNTFQGVIDSASPFITIYAQTEAKLKYLWQLIDKSTTSSFHCNYSTRYCSKPTSIMDYMTIIVEETSWNISIFQEDVLSDDYIQFFYDGDTDYTSDADYVLFLGRPFLKHVLVGLDYEEEELTFYAVTSSSSSLNWTTIGIVFGCVAAFALIFFAVYYWRYGRIPPPSNNDAEEQVSLLRGPVQAVGSSAANPVGAQSSAYSGPSGLDEDDDDYQRQLQQAQRMSAIEAQQRREQQLRVERERQEQNMLEEQKQQAQLQQAQPSSQRIGGSAPKPTSADDLRQRRLKFLDSQKQLEDVDNDDNA